jgi:glucan phosphoethanolaminetransferase (alkaline phosphatase superfamily)
MFERFQDLPLHVLVIHVVVAMLPLAALAAILFAVLPKWRWLLRLPVVVLGLGAVAVTYVARESGQAFVAAVPDLAQIVKEHEEHGDLLFWYSLAFAAVCVLAVLLLPGPSALASGRFAREGGNRVLNGLVSVVVIAISVLLVWQTYRTGDSGAKAVWDGQLPPK